MAPNQCLQSESGYWGYVVYDKIQSHDDYLLCVIIASKIIVLFFSIWR